MPDAIREARQAIAHLADPAAFNDPARVERQAKAFAKADDILAPLIAPTPGKAPGQDAVEALRLALGEPFMTCQMGGIGGAFVKLKFEESGQAQQAHNALVSLFKGVPIRPDLRAVAALEWYAEQARLCRLIHREGDSGRHALAHDGGNRARTALAAIRATQADTGGATAPAGWKLVPVEPTEAMISAYCETQNKHGVPCFVNARTIWPVMLAAAPLPTPPTLATDGEGR